MKTLGCGYTIYCLKIWSVLGINNSWALPNIVRSQIVRSLTCQITIWRNLSIKYSQTSDDRQDNTAGWCVYMVTSEPHTIIHHVTWPWQMCNGSEMKTWESLWDTYQITYQKILLSVESLLEHHFFGLTTGCFTWWTAWRDRCDVCQLIPSNESLWLRIWLQLWL